MPESEVGDAEVASSVGSPAAEQLVQVQTTRLVAGDQQALVVTVAGEIDTLTVGRFRDAAHRGLDELGAGEMLLVDLTKVTFMNSRGLQVLVELTELAQQHQRLLRFVVGDTRAVLRPLKVTELDTVVPLCVTVQDAFESSP